MAAVSASVKPKVRAVRSVRSSDAQLLSQYGADRCSPRRRLWSVALFRGGKRTRAGGLDRALATLRPAPRAGLFSLPVGR